MSNNKSYLSKGLDAILKVHHGDINLATEDARILHVALNDIIPSRYQPRKVFSEQALSELSESIKSQGIIQPLIVRNDGTAYEIIAGERRWRAAKIAGLTDVPVIVRDIDDATAMVFAIIENIQRQDLNPLEEAEALQRLLTEFSLTHDEIAKRVGHSRAAVTNKLRLLKLSDDTKEHLSFGRIDMGHARAILPLSDEEQEEIVERVIEKNLSVRETERLVKTMKKQPKKQEIQYVQQADKELLDNFKNILSNKLYSVVDIQFDSKNNKGKFIVHFDGIDELNAIITNAWPDS